MRSVGLAVVTALVLGAALALGAATHPSGPPGTLGSPAAPDVAYLRAASALLDRVDATLADEDRVLGEGDANPGLVGSAAWIARDGQVDDALQSEYRAAQTLTAPDGLGDLQTCLVEGLRLSSLGAGMLHDAFLTGGHGAYYLSAHGNWDLNLGHDRLQQCRALLVQLRVSGSGVEG